MTVRDVTDLYTEFGDERLPPGQRRTDDFLIFSMDGTPSVDERSWQFEVWGAVDDELTLSLKEFKALPSESQRQDFHCVTGWSKLDCVFTGIPFTELANSVGVHDDAVHVLFHARDGYTTDLPLADCLRDEVLFAWNEDGEPLEPAHGGPLRVVTPHKYAYKGAKWITGVEFLTEPRRGYWEKRGYSVTADPWAEDRYS
ncbi:molybdopterin-dependent oxidoreductase [Halanaeroarchaeum sp. HSR-CO]|uniref:molybdopterin-dependent oxidoreductase n=1 Tax=Halanaeroarchaeum sp. HSR-CO TaxID=2866382 RepID=UPI00217D583C|nr:molybdopterin-dependent oxidoreductase [Halanaeroarchaeum sp. HSR-CO]